VPPRVALSWYAGFRGEMVAVGDVQPGERWEFTVRLQRPHGNDMWNALNSLAPSAVMRSRYASFERTSEFRTCSYFTYRQLNC
jgi:hypothetical protein